MSDAVTKEDINSVRKRVTDSTRFIFQTPLYGQSGLFGTVLEHEKRLSTSKTICIQQDAECKKRAVGLERIYEIDFKNCLPNYCTPPVLERNSATADIVTQIPVR